ncbi:blue copper protein-like isoform X2 [Citrus sinensis]|uniref:blue copper protein-like isoform X2 n=1 Tax=Citrus clementina TaxID=85681 RepID=UPI000CECE661|nr:blue copper protein-like isoform X2 [Citrus x clementina]XP_052295999.1 blue copper protein-like isoform X2 [Citrus sinensis]
MINSHYSLAISIVVVAAVICFGSSYGLRYWVGDSVWSIPPTPNFYNDWSSSHLFRIGDSIVFDFETELYNLMQVTALDYQTCKANNPIKVLNSGPATIALNEQAPVEPLLTPLFAPSSSPEPSTDGWNVPDSPLPAPVSSQAPAYLEHTKSSSYRLQSLGVRPFCVITCCSFFFIFFSG